MSGAFQYRPKFVDIRVRKPEPAADKKSRAKPVAGVRACDHVGCQGAGEHRAPKSRQNSNEFWHFCLEHVSDYNRRWNYFSGMSEDEFAAYQKAEETGHRPTWSFRASKNDQLSAAMRGFQAGRRTDPYGVLGGGAAETTAKAAPRRRLTRLQTLAFEALHLDHDADGAKVRARYAELVKRWHPDSNGGDRSAEAELQKVVHAYQTLKAAGLV